jgi:hypothetical protein
VALNAASVAIQNGNFFHLSGTASATFVGQLLSLVNGSSVLVTGLDLATGSLVRNSGTGTFDLTGPLAFFGGGGNSLTFSNGSVCTGPCSVIEPIPNLRIRLTGGATAANVAIAGGYNPFVGLGGANTVTYVGEAAAALEVHGATGTKFNLH